jgi:carboxylesterase type B
MHVLHLFQFILIIFHWIFSYQSDAFDNYDENEEDEALIASYLSQMRGKSNSSPSVATDRSIIIDTTLGKVIGKKKNGIVSYLGIPYAEPPLGRLRFRPPRPKRPWYPAIYKATEYSPECLQSELFVPLDESQLPRDEDCLYLNIWTPNDAGTRQQAELYPVLIWIYGGAFIHGGATQPQYSGRQLAKKGVIVISFNYRVGALGFLVSISDGLYGNYGLADQKLAIQWVQDNIRSFGGDPNRITLFGESAGAMSIVLHLLDQQQTQTQDTLQPSSRQRQQQYRIDRNEHRYIRNVNTFDDIYHIIQENFDESDQHQQNNNNHHHHQQQRHQPSPPPQSTSSSRTSRKPKHSPASSLASLHDHSSSRTYYPASSSSNSAGGGGGMGSLDSTPASSTSSSSSSTKRKKLFHAVIMQSNPLGYKYRTLQVANFIGEAYKELLDCEDLRCLQYESSEELIHVQDTLMAVPRSIGDFFTWGPVITDASYYREIRLRGFARSSIYPDDGYDEDVYYSSFPHHYLYDDIDALHVSNITVRQPIEAMKELRKIDVPVIMGTNSHEGTVFVFTAFPTRMAKFIYQALVFSFFRSAAPQILKMYASLADTISESAYPDYRLVLSQIIGDYLFRCPNQYFASQLTAVGTAVYLYEFALPTRTPGFPCCDGLSCHTCEIPYVFHHIDIINNEFSFQQQTNNNKHSDSSLLGTEEKMSSLLLEEDNESEISWSDEQEEEEEEEEEEILEETKSVKKATSEKEQRIPIDKAEKQRNQKDTQRNDHVQFSSPNDQQKTNTFSPEIMEKLKTNHQSDNEERNSLPFTSSFVNETLSTLSSISASMPDSPEKGNILNYAKDWIENAFYHRSKQSFGSEFSNIMDDTNPIVNHQKPFRDDQHESGKPSAASNISPIQNQIKPRKKTKRKPKKTPSKQKEITKAKPIAEQVDQSVSRLVSDYWTTFAKFGDPNGYYVYDDGTRHTQGKGSHSRPVDAPWWPKLLGDLPPSPLASSSDRSTFRRSHPMVPTNSPTHQQQQSDNTEEIDSSETVYLFDEETNSRSGYHNPPSYTPSSAPTYGRTSRHNYGNDDDADDHDRHYNSYYNSMNHQEENIEDDDQHIMYFSFNKRSSPSSTGPNDVNKKQDGFRRQDGLQRTSSSKSIPKKIKGPATAADTVYGGGVDPWTMMRLDASTDGFVTQQRYMHQMVFGEETTVYIIENDCICNAWNILEYRF